MITRIFASGNSQALRIPKEYRTDDKEVNIEKVGNIYIISPANDPWAAFKTSLDMFTEDFMADGRKQPSLSEDTEAAFD